MEEKTKVPVVSIKDVSKAYYVLGSVLTRLKTLDNTETDTIESIESITRVMDYLKYTADKLELTNDLSNITDNYMVDIESYAGGAHISWNEYFINIAVLSSLRSKDPKKKVGACIVGLDNRILSTKKESRSMYCI